MEKFKGYTLRGKARGLAGGFEFSFYFVSASLTDLRSAY